MTFENTINGMKALLLPVCLVSILLSGVVKPWSNEVNTANRRDALARFSKVIGAVILPAVAWRVEEAQSACLPGDLSPSCIGVYKIPLEDALSSPTLNTPDALKRNAPDVHYMKIERPPTSVLRAKEILQAQRVAADDIKDVVLKGRLEEAGIKVLNLLSKIQGAGITIQEQVRSTFPLADSGENQIRVLKFQQQLQELITLWSQIDVEIGQGLRGQMGVSAVAQLEILKSLKDATAAFDDFLLVVDANVK